MLNYASIFGLKTALKLKGNDYSWLGRFVACIRSLELCIDFSIASFTLDTWVVLCSGLLSCRDILSMSESSYLGPSSAGLLCLYSRVRFYLDAPPSKENIMTRMLALCFNFAGIMVVRFFLGFLESINGPVFVIITSNWWTRSEQAFRTAFWLGGTPVSEVSSLLCWFWPSVTYLRLDWQLHWWTSDVRLGLE